ncbi:hypothetical protein JXB02_06830 [Candidatus Woesearchaeota archaeon]|nr:hypothetical protein [Candidatus Woesearchaeota archaeon]
MARRARGTLWWLPRVLGILYILFISLFAFDVPILSIGFLMHMLPSLLLVVALVIGWRWPIVGGWIFLMMGIAFVFFFNTYRQILSLLLISGPPIVLGVLFLAEGHKGQGRKVTTAKK